VLDVGEGIGEAWLVASASADGEAVAVAVAVALGVAARVGAVGRSVRLSRSLGRRLSERVGLGVAVGRAVRRVSALSEDVALAPSFEVSREEAASFPVDALAVAACAVLESASCAAGARQRVVARASRMARVAFRLVVRRGAAITSDNAPLRRMRLVHRNLGQDVLAV
jgi:hypothetical protein